MQALVPRPDRRQLFVLVPVPADPRRQAESHVRRARQPPAAEADDDAGEDRCMRQRDTPPGQRLEEMVAELKSDCSFARVALGSRDLTRYRR